MGYKILLVQLMIFSFTAETFAAYVQCQNVKSYAMEDVHLIECYSHGNDGKGTTKKIGKNKYKFESILCGGKRYLYRGYLHRNTTNLIKFTDTYSPTKGRHFKIAIPKKQEANLPLECGSHLIPEGTNRSVDDIMTELSHISSHKNDVSQKGNNNVVVKSSASNNEVDTLVAICSLDGLQQLTEIVDPPKEGSIVSSGICNGCIVNQTLQGVNGNLSSCDSMGVCNGNLKQILSERNFSAELFKTLPTLSSLSICKLHCNKSGIKCGSACSQENINKAYGKLQASIEDFRANCAHIAGGTNSNKSTNKASGTNAKQ